MKHLKNKLYFVIFLYASVAVDAVPPGFEDIPTHDISDVALYYGQSFLGKVVVEFDEGYVKFEDMQKLKEKLGFVTDVPLVLKSLSGKINPHYDYVCHQRDKKLCKHFTPKIAAVILDTKKDKIKLLVHPDYLKPALLPEISYIKDSQVPLSHVHQFNANLNGQNDSYTFRLNIKDIVSRRNDSIVMQSTLQANDTASNPIYNIQDLDYVHYDQRMIYRAGLLSTGSGLFTPSMACLGINVATNQGLMQNKKVRFGTPLEFNPRMASTIEILKDQQVLLNRFFQPGNYYLQTSRFPAGVYTITIRVTKVDGTVTERQQLFVKNTSMPAMHHPEYNVTLGQVENSDQGNSVLPKISSQWVLQSEYDRRMKRQSVLHIGEFLKTEYGLAEIGYTWFNTTMVLTPSVALTTKNAYGVGLTYTQTFNPKLKATLMTRHLFHQQKLYEALANQQKILDNEINGQLRYQRLKYGLNLGLTRKKTYLEPATYAIHLSGQRSLPTFKKMNGTLSGNISKNQDGWSLHIGLSLSRKRKKMNHSLHLTMARQTDDLTTKTTKGLNYQVGHTKPQKSYNLTLSHQQNNLNDATTLSGNYRHNAGKGILWQANGSYNKTQSEASVFSYSLSTQPFGFVSTHGHWGWSPQMKHTSGILVHIDTDLQKAKFDVSIGSRRSYPVSNNTYRFLGLRAFVNHKLMVTSVSDTLFEVDHPPEPFILYPHNVMFFEFKARSYYTLMGTFQNPKGEPIKDAGIEGSVSFGDTDDAGFGQVEVYTDSTITLFTEDGKACVVDTKGFKPENNFLWMDNIPCTPKK